MPTLKVWDGSAWVEVKGDKGDPGEVTNDALESRVAPIEGDVSAIDTRVTALPTIIAGNYTKRLSNYGNDLQAAIADLPDGGAHGGEIQVDGEVDVSGPVSIPPSIHLVGRGTASTALIAPDALNTPLITMDGASRSAIADLSLSVDDSRGTGTNSRAILITGDAQDITLDRVEARGFHANVQVIGDAGVSPGVVRNLVLSSVRADSATGSFGISLANVDGVTLNSCTANENWLDGLKFQARAHNVKDIGGIYNRNGQSWINGGGSVGDGVDAFAGGDTVTLIGTTAEYNNGNGILIKTDGLNDTDPETFGYVRNLQISNVTCRFNDPGYGLAVITFNAPTTPSLAHAVITAGQYEGNKNAGLYLNGRNIEAIAPMSRKNGRQGIYIGPDALYVSLVSPLVVANSQSNAGQYHGIDIAGRQVSVRGGTIIGVDADAIHDESELASLTRYHNRSVHVQNGASDVYVDIDFAAYHTEAGGGIQVNATSGTVVQNSYSTNNPRGWTSGGPGSMWINTQADNEADVYWVRRNVALTPNSTQGWRRLSGLPVVTTLPAAAAHSEGDMVMLKSGGNPPGVPYICVNTTGSTYAWKELVLA